MAQFAFTSSGSIGMSSKTFAQAKTQVARVLGSQDDTAEVGAGDAIRMAIDRLNEFEWDYLTVEGNDLTTTSNVADLPTPWKKPLSLRLSDRPLPFARIGNYESIVFDTSGTVPTHYTLFNSQLSGQVRLIPGAADGTVVTIKYYRPVAKPQSDSETLDVLDWMERYVILEAQAQLLMEQGDDNQQAMMIAGRAQDALMALLGSDRSPGPDEDQGFIPWSAWGSRRFDQDHAQTYIQDLQG